MPVFARAVQRKVSVARVFAEDGFGGKDVIKAGSGFPGSDTFGDKCDT